MAFLNRISGVLRQTVNKHMNMELSAYNTSLYQAVRNMSSSKLFVGGLSYGTDEMSLREAFSQHGEVVEARIIMDRETGRSRGFAFVTYTSSDEASSAIQALDGQDLHGRRIRVNYATEKPRAGGFRGGFGNEGGFGYGGGSGNYGGSGGYGNSSYGGAGGYGDASNYGGGYGNGSNYGDAGGGNFGGGRDGYGTSSYGGGSGYDASNYNSSNIGNYAGGTSSSHGGAGTATGGDYFNSGINNDSGVDTSGHDQGQLGGDQVENVTLEEDFGDDNVEGNYREENDTSDSYANTRG